jgi:septal ring factor EnvC (AmiA/AmiB activator)
MIVPVELEPLKKKIANLENELASQEQKEQTMIENIRKLMEKVAIKLEENIKAKNAVLEKFESMQKDLEKKLDELQENREPSSSPNAPTTVAEEKEESPKQVIEVAAGGSQQSQPEEPKELHKQEKKHRWPY